MESLPTISSLPGLPTETKDLVLDTLFEPSETLHKLALPLLSPPHEYDSYSTLISSIRALLLSLSVSDSPSDKAQLIDILSSHPRLGEKKVDSALSRKEQAQLQQQTEQAQAGKETEAEELKRLNDEYEKKFPGLRYTVFVNGRGRPEILADLRKRVNGSYPPNFENEIDGIIRALCDIANDRVKKLSS